MLSSKKSSSSYDLVIHKADIKKRDYSYFVLGGDIGGTNARLAVAGIKNGKVNLLLSFNLSSDNLDLTDAINSTLDHCRRYYGIKVNSACLGIAAEIKDENKPIKLINGRLVVDKKDIIKNTPISSLILMNDFEIVGYGLNTLGDPDIKVIKKGDHVKDTKALIGAGTGLGKSIVLFNKERGIYVPIRSEGGHADFPIENKLELELIYFIKKYRKVRSVSYEDVLSGRGIENIFLFLASSRRYRNTSLIEQIKESDNMPEMISKHRNKELICRDTLDIFASIYARAARNFALESLSKGGIYIAGGIAVKNKDIFHEQMFNKIFNRNDRKEIVRILERIPVYLITDSHIALKGACFAAALTKH